MRPVACPTCTTRLPFYKHPAAQATSKGNDFPNSPHPTCHARSFVQSFTSLGVVTLLLEAMAGRDLNKRTRATGQTPLHLAVRYGHADVARALIRAGGDVNITDTRGRSPLIRAASDGRAELVNDLLLRGSRVNARDNNRDTALSIAVRLGHLDVSSEHCRATGAP